MSKDLDSSSFISLLEKGEKVAFEALYRLYFDKLVHIAKGYLINRLDAEGVVQTVFIKIWERRDELGSIKNINNYLYSSTKNACLDKIKHQKVKDNYFNIAQHNKTIAIFDQFAHDDSASLLIEKELEKRILNSIDLLPKECKKIFVKSRLEGLKNIEIANELGISKKTVDNQIAKALKHMRLQLKDYLTSLFL